MISAFDPAIFRPEHEEAQRNAFFAKHGGFFVEVGANDPVILSQTHSLEQQGWDGILVEPLPDQAERLRRQRKAQVLEYACSSPAMAGKEMVLHVAGIYSSLKADIPTIGVVSDASVQVQVQTLDHLLEMANAPSPLDFVSIDVEGVEIEVLDGFDLSRWQPQLLVVEDRALDFTLHRYLKRRGYRWIRRFALNNWYVPATSSVRPSFFGRAQFIRKYYLGMYLRRLKRTRPRPLGM